MFLSKVMAYTVSCWRSSVVSCYARIAVLLKTSRPGSFVYTSFAWDRFLLPTVETVLADISRASQDLLHQWNSNYLWRALAASAVLGYFVWLFIDAVVRDHRADALERARIKAKVYRELPSIVSYPPLTCTSAPFSTPTALTTPLPGSPHSQPSSTPRLSVETPIRSVAATSSHKLSSNVVYNAALLAAFKANLDSAPVEVDTIPEVASHDGPSEVSTPATSPTMQLVDPASLQLPPSPEPPHLNQDIPRQTSQSIYENTTVALPSEPPIINAAVLTFGESLFSEVFKALAEVGSESCHSGEALSVLTVQPRAIVIATGEEGHTPALHGARAAKLASPPTPTVSTVAPPSESRHEKKSDSPSLPASPAPAHPKNTSFVDRSSFVSSPASPAITLPPRRPSKNSSVKESVLQPISPSTSQTPPRHSKSTNRSLVSAPALQYLTPRTVPTVSPRPARDNVSRPALQPLKPSDVPTLPPVPTHPSLSKSITELTRSLRGFHVTKKFSYKKRKTDDSAVSRRRPEAVNTIFSTDRKPTALALKAKKVKKVEVAVQTSPATRKKTSKSPISTSSDSPVAADPIRFLVTPPTPEPTPPNLTPTAFDCDHLIHALDAPSLVPESSLGVFCDTVPVLDLPIHQEIFEESTAELLSVAKEEPTPVAPLKSLVSACLEQEPESGTVDDVPVEIPTIATLEQLISPVVQLEIPGRNHSEGEPVPTTVLSESPTNVEELLSTRINWSAKEKWAVVDSYQPAPPSPVLDVAELSVVSSSASTAPTDLTSCDTRSEHTVNTSLASACEESCIMELASLSLNDRQYHQSQEAEMLLPHALQNLHLHCSDNPTVIAHTTVEIVINLYQNVVPLSPPFSQRRDAPYFTIPAVTRAMQRIRTKKLRDAKMHHPESDPFGNSMKCHSVSIATYDYTDPSHLYVDVSMAVPDTIDGLPSPRRISASTPVSMVIRSTPSPSKRYKPYAPELRYMPPVSADITKREERARQAYEQDGLQMAAYADTRTRRGEEEEASDDKDQPSGTTPCTETDVAGEEKEGADDNVDDEDEDSESESDDSESDSSSADDDQSESDSSGEENADACELPNPNSLDAGLAATTGADDWRPLKRKFDLDDDEAALPPRKRVSLATQVTEPERPRITIAFSKLKRKLHQSN